MESMQTIVEKLNGKIDTKFLKLNQRLTNFEQTQIKQWF